MLAELKISRNDAGQTADRYLRKYFPRMSLDRLHSLFRRKEIKAGRKPIARGYLLAEGDMLRVYGLREEEIAGAASGAGNATPAVPATSPFEIPVLFEDADILVLDKPAGLAVHPGTGIRPGESLIEKVWSRLESVSGGGRLETELFQPALVHRLDKDTSGVLLVAKTGESLRKLTAALRAGRFTKRYLALVEGVPEPPEGSIEAGLRRMDSRTGGAKAEVSGDGKRAFTRYKTVKTFVEFSLLSVDIETGRMHQIRAHLAHVGHPLAGDSRYGIRERNRVLRKTLGLKRIFLHASDLEVGLGPNEKLIFHSPLPEDISLILKQLPRDAFEA